VRYPISLPNVLFGNKICRYALTTTFHELSQRVNYTVLKLLKTGQGRYMLVGRMKSFLRGYNVDSLIVFRARN